MVRCTVQPSTARHYIYNISNGHDESVKQEIAADIELTYIELTYMTLTHTYQRHDWSLLLAHYREYIPE